MPHRLRGIAGAALVVAATLTGCAAGPTDGLVEPPANLGPITPLSELEVVDDPFAYEGPSTAILHDTAIEPVMTDPPQALPVTVVSDDLGGPVEVTVADTSRVIALDISGSLAATVWGLGFGDSLIARDQTTTFPGAVELPIATSGSHSVNAEAIIALGPSLVITDGSVGPRDVIEQLREVGIPVVFIEHENSFEGAEDLARSVAAVYGAPEVGELLADRIAAQIDAVERDIRAIAPTPGLGMVFLYLRGGSGVYYLFGEESGADELITAIGGIDMASAVGWKGMQPVTDEALIAANPDLILVMTEGLESVGGVDGLLEEVPAIALTTAGKHRRIVDMSDGQVLSFGPRTAGVLDALARAIYAPQAG